MIKKAGHALIDYGKNINVLIDSLINKRPLIYVLGDSHIMKFLGHKGFIVYKIASCTAYKLNSSDSTTDGRKKLFNCVNKLPTGSTILLVFGEIDARIHVYKQFLKHNKPINKICKDIVYNYGSVIDEISKKGFKIVVHGIPAPTDKAPETPLKERIIIHKTLNNELKRYCKLHGYIYWDIYSFAVDEKGLLKNEFVSDEIHMNSNSLENFNRLRAINGI